MRNSTIVAVLIVLFVILGGWYWWSLNGGPAMPGVSRGSQACTMEAMVCPDGSSVGRTGPNCAFAPCPTPGGSAGVNGSANQGNMGGSAADDNGIGDASMPGQPGADGAEGSIIGNNLALSTHGAAGGSQSIHLIAYNGRALYTYANDRIAASACYGTCEATWPPYLVGPEDNVHNVKMGVTGRIDTITRPNGGIQVTYNGSPLYYYSQDTNDGEALGAGKSGVWFAAKP